MKTAILCDFQKGKVSCWGFLEEKTSDWAFLEERPLVGAFLAMPAWSALPASLNWQHEEEKQASV